MSISRKKVIVRRFSGDALPGYLPPAAFVRNNSLDLLDLSGRILSLPLADIKTVCYVREFNLSDPVNPERLTRRVFLARPRTEGLWLRLTFRTGDLLEGLPPIPPCSTPSSTTPASSSPRPTPAPTLSASTSPVPPSPTSTSSPSSPPPPAVRPSPIAPPKKTSRTNSSTSPSTPTPAQISLRPF